MRIKRKSQKTILRMIPSNGMRTKIIVFCIGIFSIMPNWSQQGNYNYNNFGNRSILLSGNVTGSVTDIGLVFYNPARLTSIENTGFAFNAKAYQLNSLVLTTILDEERQIENTSFGGIPSMAGGTFKLFGERFGYSFISRRRNDLNLGISSNQITDNILNFFPSTENYGLNASVNSSVREDWYGLTWATELNENLSLGISAFGSSYRDSGSRKINHTIQYNSDAVAYYLTQTGFSQKSYGLYLKLGMSYKLNSIDLGLNINLPYLEIYEDASYNYNEVVSGVGSGSDVFYTYGFDSLEATRKEPFGISIGAGIPVNRSKIHLNLDFVSGILDFTRISIPDIDIGQPNLTPVPFNEERRAIINFGVGGEVYISEKFRSFFGFSTDYNAYKTNTSVFDLTTNDPDNTAISTNFFHFSGGIDWKMSWASIILGITYATGSADFNNPFQINASGLDFNNTQNSNLKNRRYQTIIGLEIPIIEKTINTFNKKTGSD